MLRELHTSYTSIPNLRARIDFMSTESSGTFLNNISSFFINKFKSFQNFFNVNFLNFSSKTDPFITNYLKIYEKNIKEIKKLNYLTVSNLKIPWQEGICVDLLTATKTTFEVCLSLDGVVMAEINQTDTMLSKLIADPEALSSVRAVHNVTDMKSFLDTNYRKLDSILNFNTHPKDQAVIKEAIPNLTSLDNIADVFKDIEKLKLYNSFANLDKLIKNIKLKIDELSNKLSKAEYKNVNKTTLSNLCDKIENAAKLVTLAGTALYMISSISDTGWHVINVLAPKK